MAAASFDRAACKKCLEDFNELSAKDGTMKLSPLKKCMIAMGLKNYCTTLESSIWTKYGGKALPIDKILDTVLPDLANYEANKDKKNPKDPEPIKNDIFSKLAKGKPEEKKTKTTAAVDRLTDTSKYTGAHKERFDASGKGKGAAGREDRCDNSGYVGNYKGQDTYDKTH